MVPPQNKMILKTETLSDKRPDRNKNKVDDTHVLIYVEELFSVVERFLSFYIFLCSLKIIGPHIITFRGKFAFGIPKCLVNFHSDFP